MRQEIDALIDDLIGLTLVQQGETQSVRRTLDSEQSCTSHVLPNTQ